MPFRLIFISLKNQYWELYYMGIFNSKLIIFDLDGTIVDSKEDIAISVNHALKENGLPALPEDKIYSFVGNGVDFLLEKSLGKSKMEHFDNVKNTFMTYYEEHLLDNSKLFEGIMTVLDHFKGEKKMVILSNKPTHLCAKITKGLEIESYFEEIHGAESFEALKPDPIGVKTLYKKYEVLQEECIVVGDAPQDINAAKNAGVKMAAVTYGFHSENRLKKENPDLLLDTIEALINYIN